MMNTATQDGSEVTDSAIKNTYWMVGLGLLAVRIIQGFIYWGGGSRRFIYAPDKLNPDAPHWMAYKFQTAMPGALLGLEHVISFMLQHFWLLYAGVILFSAAELIAGLFLMLGLFTRISALLSMLFSVLLMLMFGWQGATCIDEWTMAACNLAMGTTIFLCGSHVYALDNILLKKRPHLAGSRIFKWCCGSLPLPLSPGAYKKLALGLLAFVVIFDVGTYSYYRGSVVTPYHHGPVSPTTHHITLTDVTIRYLSGDAKYGITGSIVLTGFTVRSCFVKSGSGRIIGQPGRQVLHILQRSAVKHISLFIRNRQRGTGFTGQ